MNLGTCNCAPLVNPLVETAFPSITSPTTRGILTPGTLGNLDCTFIKMRAIMRVTFGATSCTFTPGVRSYGAVNTDLTTLTGDGVFVTIAASAARSNATVIWMLLFNLTTKNLGDGFSSGWGGMFRHQFDATLTATAAVTQLSSSTFIGMFNFFCTGIFSASDAGNSVALTEFAIDQD